ncbi:zinc-binding dehydrogenase [Virgisporangium aliadipatigenens]|uniref:Zinc-binding dehydrogenase n=1 Tax=Virgisporangium aliadipatigenens TaxID=741659 RepID=A0A8J4DNM4_9ACTN|nr:zinc-binding dehydrogenase [Virgisporangium aliadipatigenens]
MVVTSFGATPTYQEFREPEAAEGESVVTVHAAPLSPIVRKLAAGTHYTSGAAAGFVPGVDGVGVDENGRRVYFLFPKAPFGSMAQRSLVATGSTVPVPPEMPSERAATVAAAGLASWVALTRRAPLHGGETVLVVGATGAAGGMALRTARHLGAGRVVAVGRDPARLARLDADARIGLDGGADAALRAEFDRGVDVVLDFVWGAPAERVLRAATEGRGSRTGEPRLRYVQLGNDAGAEIPLRADTLRGSGLELLGSGVGSVAVADLVAGAAELLAAGFDAPYTAVPLRDAERVWNADPAVRHILVPE